MGPPTLAAADVPTTLPPTNAEGAVVGAALEVDGRTWRVTCVSMGNPHCVTFGNDAEAVSKIDPLIRYTEGFYGVHEWYVISLLLSQVD